MKQAHKRPVWPAIVVVLTIMAIVAYVAVFALLMGFAGGDGFENVWGKPMTVLFAPLLWLDANFPSAHQLFLSIRSWYLHSSPRENMGELEL